MSTLFCEKKIEMRNRVKRTFNIIIEIKEFKKFSLSSHDSDQQ